MSEVLKKYKEKTEYLQHVVRAYQDLATALLNHFKKHVEGDEQLLKSITTLATKVKDAENIFQVQQIHKTFLSLNKKIDAHIAETLTKNKGNDSGGFFSSIGALFGDKGTEAKAPPEETRKPGEGITLVDKTSKALAPYILLLDEFSRGALLLADEREPFYAKLRAKRSKKFDKLSEADVESIRRSLYNFFTNKANEAGTVEHEREELKKIISSLTTYIQSLSLSSQSFGAKLDIYAKKIETATSLEEIKLLKRGIMTETMEIQKVNHAVLEKLQEADRNLDKAGNTIAHLEKELRMAREEQWVDEQTGIYNRAYFDERFKEAVTAFKANKKQCSLLIVDIDDFKTFNDTYGQHAGDQVLRVLAGIIKETVKASETVARFGGEEFAVILYEIAQDKDFKIAEEIRRNIMAHEFVAKDKTINVTASIGIAEFSDSDNVNRLIGRASKALAEAQNKGHNQTARILA
ncbi:hypothetical protein MNBD_NITROSPINAE01-1755 [hydrothermal vent metagenome]|uniref:GGDEF domain-containing protein n=1 Tax=hydrothermal vent metagenome TaxID=652676 RepID=A0A3B1CJG6_9ZZZZ